MKTLHQLNPSYMDAVIRRTLDQEKLCNLDQASTIIRSHVNHGASCLDVGGASGYFFNYIQDHIGFYTCLDAEKEYTEYGSRFYAPLGNRVSFVTADMMREGIAASHDVVVCLGLFYTFPDFRAPLERLMFLSKGLILIRALFSEVTELRYVPAFPGSADYCHYNIFGYSEITSYALNKGWTATWIRDRYRTTQGGEYRTAGMNFPFTFLLLKKEE